MRLFIAFPVSQEAEKEMRSVQGQMRVLNPNARVKWVGDEGFHVTVVFLGDVEIVKIVKIKEIIGQVFNRYKNFEFYLDKIDAFPNQHDVKIIVAKIGEKGSESLIIYNELLNDLKNFGLEIENRRWHPHLTLGRNKFGDKIIGFEQVEVKKVEWQVDRIELIESELKAEGPKYTILENFFLQ